jgi:hypothetical protein
MAPHSAINPMFQVVSTRPALACGRRLTRSQTPMPEQPPDPPPLQTSLPPFSQLEAVAEHEYPPLSPMSFYRPGDDD